MVSPSDRKFAQATKTFKHSSTKFPTRHSRNQNNRNISRKDAKAQSKKPKNFRTLASRRLGARNIRIREFPTFAKFAQTAKTFPNPFVPLRYSSKKPKVSQAALDPRHSTLNGPETRNLKPIFSPSTLSSPHSTIYKKDIAPPIEFTPVHFFSNTMPNRPFQPAAETRFDSMLTVVVLIPTHSPLINSTPNFTLICRLRSFKRILTRPLVSGGS